MATPLGERLRRLRTEKKLTLEKLAELAQCSKSYIWELENRPASRPAAEKIIAIAKVLDVTAEYLLGDKDASMPATKKESTPEDVAFFRRYMGMKHAEKEKLREMSDVMFKKKDD